MEEILGIFYHFLKTFFLEESLNNFMEDFLKVLFCALIKNFVERFMG